MTAADHRDREPRDDEWTVREGLRRHGTRGEKFEPAMAALDRITAESARLREENERLRVALQESMNVMEAMLAETDWPPERLATRLRRLVEIDRRALASNTEPATDRCPTCDGLPELNDTCPDPFHQPATDSPKE